MIKRLATKHPATVFAILTLVWSWGMWSVLFTMIRPGGILDNPLPLAYLFVFLGGLGPSLTGLVLTRYLYGKEGLRSLKDRLSIRNIGKWWAAILIIPSLTFAPLVLRQLWGGYQINVNSMSKNLIPGITIGLMAGLMEEFGWRGFMLPQLLKKYPPLIATLILGLVWGGLWHGYADYFGLGDRGVYFWPMVILVGPMLLTAWSVVMTFVYLKTKGNLLVQILMHAGISSSAYIFGQRYESYPQELWWTMVSVSVALSAAGIISKFTGNNFERN